MKGSHVLAMLALNFGHCTANEQARQLNCNAVAAIVTAVKAVNKADAFCTSFLKLPAQVTKTTTVFSTSVTTVEKGTADLSSDDASTQLEKVEIKRQAGVKCSGAPAGLAGLACSLISSACNCIVTRTKTVSTTQPTTSTKTSTVTQCTSLGPCPTGITFAIQQVSPVAYVSLAPDFYYNPNTCRTLSVPSSGGTLATASRFRFILDTAGRCRLSDPTLANSVSGAPEDPGQFTNGAILRIFQPGTLFNSFNGVQSQENPTVCQVDATLRLTCVTSDLANPESTYPQFYNDGYVRVGTNVDGEPNNFIIVPVA